MLLTQAGGAQVEGLSVGVGVRSVPTRLVVPGLGVGVGRSILVGAARLLCSEVPGPVYGRLGSVQVQVRIGLGRDGGPTRGSSPGGG